MDDLKRQTPKRRTVDVPDAGAVLGLSRGAAFAAVKRGDIPVLKIGRRLLVPVAALEKLLEGDRSAEGGAA